MGIGRRPSLKRPALALARRKKALELLVACKSLTAIAAELNISVQSVRKHLRKALETDSLFPPSLDADQVGQLRQIEAERLIRLWEKTHSTLESVNQGLEQSPKRT
jgi:predicted ArsR family transcriptional regulator